jgi:hypothetical protein
VYALYSGVALSVNRPYVRFCSARADAAGIRSARP